MASERRHKVVVVGAGFAGLWAIRALAKAPVDVVLVDRNNYHTFLPLLYQVAAAELVPENIAYPVRSVLRKIPNAQFRLGNVKSVDFARQVVQTEDSEISYDFLVLAVGSVSDFLGIPGAGESAFSLKTLEQGIALRNQILAAFEQATHEPDVQRRRQILTFVIVGGGPTGVEFAGALAELVRGPLARDFPGLDFKEVRLVLVEAMDRLLRYMPDRASAYALRRLRGMGVEVHLNAFVSAITREALCLKDGAVINTRTVIWTAGVQGDPLARTFGLPTHRDGRLAVLPTLQLLTDSKVYIVGDAAYLEQDGHPLPMTAPVAIQQGALAAQNIRRQIAGQAPKPFRYWDKGTMVTIGRNAAVAYLARRCFAGFLAWIIWLGVHLFELIGFHNRILVLIDWAWDYLLYERTVRLILPSKMWGREGLSEAPSAKRPPAVPL